MQRQLTSSKTRLIQCYGNTGALYKPTEASCSRLTDPPEHPSLMGMPAGAGE